MEKKPNVEKQRHLKHNSNVTIVAIALSLAGYYIKNTLITSNDIANNNKFGCTRSKCPSVCVVIVGSMHIASYMHACRQSCLCVCLACTLERGKESLLHAGLAREFFE